MLSNRLFSSSSTPSHFTRFNTRSPPHRSSPSTRNSPQNVLPRRHLGPRPLNHVISPKLFELHFFRQSRFCSSQAVASAAKSSFSLVEWRRSTIDRLKAKKAQLLVEYGSTFIFLHEALGIASYLTCFGIASLGLLSIDDIINFIGIVPDHIKDMISLKEGTITTTALTALVLLKCLDFLGLTPLRWALAITLTPRIAWWVGPRVDASVAWVKARFTKRPIQASPTENNP